MAVLVESKLRFYALVLVRRLRLGDTLVLKSCVLQSCEFLSSSQLRPP